MTVRALARTLGYTAYSYISDIETSKTTPRIEFILKIADLFQVTTDQLVRDELELPPERTIDGSDEAQEDT
jgi:transcriptional regulator with XRE-family HTH domain